MKRAISVIAAAVLLGAGLTACGEPDRNTYYQCPGQPGYHYPTGTQAPSMRHTPAYKAPTTPKKLPTTKRK